MTTKRTRQGTKSRNAKPSEQAEAAEQPRTRGGDDRAALPGAVFGSVIDLQRSFIRLVSGILVNSDIAFRRDRRLQRMMRHDPDVMGPLMQRQMAVGLLEWDIVPEDKADEQQVEQCENLKNLISRNLRKWHDFIRHLQEAIWYGPSAANMIYSYVPEGIAPTDWFPLHPDSLVFTKEGALGLRVGQSYEPQSKTVIAWDSRAVLFDDLERRAVVSHTFMKQGPDFEEPYESRYMFSGRGLRDVVWFQWFTKQIVLQLWVTYAERYAMGVRKGTYPAGNAEAKSEMETVLRNLLGDMSVVLPREAGKNMTDTYSLEILEPNSTTSDVFASLLNDYLGGKIKELIIGQSATTEGTTSGLGSSVGDQHAETFGRIIRYDANCLADTLTHELVRPMHYMNHGETGWLPRFEFNTADVDPEKFLNAVDKFIQLGGNASMRQVRGRIGLEEPIEGEEVLETQQQMDPMAEDFGGGGGLDIPQKKKRDEYARALK